eukprot:CAMPEP_0181215500 /NCGR_PEP_ID=MMETSP1096-20121128/26049_1 /TAXON_ID=156174 ORGANISM="Chrysochromulina ericina, Strain CCMP281" /NCGR_SAMPLE_ID=MMETSP1096 /ASSEMBLY_ACC=CAM_ASM_000453 /LENGTH=91 /DNA_ID=CAMNT_0023307365 /DNA_START=150 /DNA_END=425 /DNA_ORIENTATION=+
MPAACAARDELCTAARGACARAHSFSSPRGVVGVRCRDAPQRYSTNGGQWRGDALLIPYDGECAVADACGRPSQPYTLLRLGMPPSVPPSV